MVREKITGRPEIRTPVPTVTGFRGYQLSHQEGWFAAGGYFIAVMVCVRCVSRHPTCSGRHCTSFGICGRMTRDDTRGWSTRGVSLLFQYPTLPMQCSTLLMRCFLFLREGFTHTFPSLTVKPQFLYSRHKLPVFPFCFICDSSIMRPQVDSRGISFCVNSINTPTVRT